MEILEILIGILETFILSADIFSWMKGKANRVERKEARNAGIELPPRDPWNRWAVVLTILFCVLGIGPAGPEVRLRVTPAACAWECPHEVLSPFTVSARSTPDGDQNFGRSTPPKN